MRGRYFCSKLPSDILPFDQKFVLFAELHRYSHHIQFNRNLFQSRFPFFQSFEAHDEYFTKRRLNRLISLRHHRQKPLIWPMFYTIISFIFQITKQIADRQARQCPTWL
jgi:hypothetical protein